MRIMFDMHEIEFVGLMPTYVQVYAGTLFTDGNIVSYELRDSREGFTHVENNTRYGNYLANETLLQYVYDFWLHQSTPYTIQDTKPIIFDISKRDTVEMSLPLVVI